VAVFPTDTVYGVCCDPDSEAAARNLYVLKGRPPARACAVMFFSLEPALALLEELSDAERLALQALLPGPVTVLLSNPRSRFAPACRRDPLSLGLRVPHLPEPIGALREVAVPVLAGAGACCASARWRSRRWPRRSRNFLSVALRLLLAS
jgi:L-threonylcarbamoyladenylate synthase